MKKPLVSLVLLVCFLVTLVFAGCQTAPTVQTAKTFRLGIIPSENAQETLQQFSPLIAYLEEQMKVKIEPYVATDYNGVVEAMRTNHIDAAMFGPFSYIMAAERAGAEACVVRVAENGSPTYNSYFITHKDSGIKTLNDLKGKNFAFTDPASTSGYLVPAKVLLDNGIAAKDFASVIYSNGHDASVLAVKNKKIDAACVDEMSYGRAVEKGIITKDEVPIIYTCPPIPQSPFAVAKNLDPALRTKFIEAMTKVHELKPDTLIPLKASKYVAASDDSFQIIRDTAKALNLDLTKIK
ncbi:MAG TPA: phosphonate ABC transporter substrate-binding protein [Methylomusa anaerophila]|uniref:Phosphate-import protein PhnD n=1 Tax=Methylomusa anaerophila TaxID=1930071 RepID=A0A348AGS0_9FIRM|nr:phosphonate ABC transporter substrate-binding protein [Methylomusa anaerophila]BBB90268.1 phosphate-import protein PhnD precursor [Methylomusa anaerophila]HML89386.1 phosphonate ABC transporter substrate-binding protein [Methylomusa anaerophila]